MCLKTCKVTNKYGFLANKNDKNCNFEEDCVLICNRLSKYASVCE